MRQMREQVSWHGRSKEWKWRKTQRSTNILEKMMPLRRQKKWSMLNKSRVRTTRKTANKTLGRAYWRTVRIKRVTTWSHIRGGVSRDLGNDEHRGNGNQLWVINGPQLAHEWRKNRSVGQVNPKSTAKWTSEAN
jgi:hypothetical protein